MITKTSVHLYDDSVFTQHNVTVPEPSKHKNWGVLDIGDENDPGQLTIFVSNPAQLDALISAATSLRASMDGDK